MDKLFFVWFNFEAFSNTPKFTCTQRQIDRFKDQLRRDTSDGVSPQFNKAFLQHSNGEVMVSVPSLHNMKIEAVTSDFSEKILFEAIEKDPQRVLHLALEKIVGGILAQSVGEQKAYLEKITESLKSEIRVAFLEGKMAPLQEKICVTLDESRKKGSMEKYDPKDDRLLTKPHCCVQAHGLMREATPEERLAAIKKAS